MCRRILRNSVHYKIYRFIVGTGIEVDRNLAVARDNGCSHVLLQVTGLAPIQAGNLTLAQVKPGFIKTQTCCWGWLLYVPRLALARTVGSDTAG